MSDQQLDRARRAARLSRRDLWVRYVGMGGEGGPLELEAYLLGALEPPDHEHDLIAHTINERFVEQGEDHPVPYRRPI